MSEVVVTGIHCSRTARIDARSGPNVRGARAGIAGLELMLDAGRRLLARNRLAPGDIDWLIPAQTHAGTVEALCDGLGLPRAKLVWSGDVTGYAASASIAATLGARRHDHTLHKGDLVLSLAVGAGMNVAGASTTADLALPTTDLRMIRSLPARHDHGGSMPSA